MRCLFFTEAREFFILAIDRVGVVFDSFLDVKEFEENALEDELVLRESEVIVGNSLSTHPLLNETLESLRLRFLLLVLLDFACNPPSLCKVECRVLSGLFLLFLRLLVFACKLERPADLFNELRELARGLGGDSFDVSLEDEEVFGFHQDVM